MSDPAYRCDVGVIGGGPAGATIAARLAALGHDVILVEASPCAGAHVAASLGPDCIALLDHVGVGAALGGAGFIDAVRPQISWDGEADNGASAEPWGLHVERGRFDQILIDHAKALGVRVLQPVRAGRPARTVQAAHASWRFVLEGGSAATLDCCFWVDATGRRAAFGARRRLSPPTLALTARWPTLGNESGRGVLEAGRAEWMWCAPSRPGETVAMLMIAPERLRGLGRAAIATFYQRLLKGSVVVGARLGTAPIGTIMSCDASLSVGRTLVGHDFIRIGDAALTIDPLSSQGVQSAVASALQAAIVVNTLLCDPQEATLATAFYKARVTERAAAHSLTAANQYVRRVCMGADLFWHERARLASIAAPGSHTRAAPVVASPQTMVALARSLTFVSAPVIAGDRIIPQQVIMAPGLVNHVAFLGDVAVAPLLQCAPLPSSAGSLVEYWSEMFGPARAEAIFDWLWERAILVPERPRGFGPHSARTIAQHN